MADSQRRREEPPHPEERRVDPRARHSDHAGEADEEECSTPATSAGGVVLVRMDAPEVSEAGRAAVDLAEASVVDDEEDGRQRTGHELGLHGARQNDAWWHGRAAAIARARACTYRRKNNHC